MPRAVLIAFVAASTPMIAFAAEPEDDGAKLHRYFAQASNAFAQLEFVQMYRAIASGRMSGNDGWFKPSQCRYDWKWLAARCDANKDGKITPAELGGSPTLFEGLDRDRDGGITSADLDWSDSSPFLRQLQQARQMLQPWDGDGDQKLTKAEWDTLFQKLSRGKEQIDAVDLMKLLPRPPGPPSGARPPTGSMMPRKELLLERLWTGELGSPFAGPKLGDPAPEFTLKTHDGKQKISLFQYRYQKPVVLIFGSFT
jgi:hypothetical protein